MNQIYQQPNIPAPVEVVLEAPRPLDYMRQAAALRSYTTPAVITLFLYLCGWLPGVITNFIYLSAANSDSRVSGLEPQGRGCLQAMLVLFFGIPVAGVVGLFGVPLLFHVLGSIF